MHFRANGESFYVGYFADEIEAAKAYDREALRWLGEFARPNFPLQQELVQSNLNRPAARGVQLTEPRAVNLKRPNGD